MNANGEIFSIQALNDSLSGQPTLVEISLRADGKQKRNKSLKGRSKSKGGGEATKQQINLVGSHHNSLEDNIRNQLMMTSINEDILDQWSAEQEKTKLADNILLKWNKIKEKYRVLAVENQEIKDQLESLMEENNDTRQKFTALLDQFQ